MFAHKRAFLEVLGPLVPDELHSCRFSSFERFRSLTKSQTFDASCALVLPAAHATLPKKQLRHKEMTWVFLASTVL